MHIHAITNFAPLQVMHRENDQFLTQSSLTHSLLLDGSSTNS